MRRILLGCVLLLAIAGCSSDETVKTKDISGLLPPLAFTLTGEDGDVLRGENLRGRTTLVYFGFMNCPDLCPATLGRLAATLQRLPADKTQDLRVLFVSVDPKRDTPKKLADYTSAFGPQFVGATGTQAQLITLTKRYRVTYGYGEPDADGNYTVSHSSGVYVFDSQGRVRLLFRQGDTPAAMAHDLTALTEAG